MPFKALIAITITARILIKVMSHVNFLVLQGVSQTLDIKNRPPEFSGRLKAFIESFEYRTYAEYWRKNI